MSIKTKKEDKKIKNIQAGLNLEQKEASVFVQTDKISQTPL